MNKELEKAIENIKEQLKHTKQANECGLGTKGEFDKDIKAIETVLNYIENSIPKQVVEEKINKLKECKTKKAYKDKNIISKSLENMRIITINAKVQILEELLEGK